MRSEASVRAAVAATTARFGRLDVVVNNAAVFEICAARSAHPGAVGCGLRDQCAGAVSGGAGGAAASARRQGRIVNIGSLGGMNAWAGHAHYCASKAALHMLTQAMAKAFAPEVSVNCVAPGWIDLDDRPAEEAVRFAARTPMRRNGTRRRCGSGGAVLCHRAALCHRPGSGRGWRAGAVGGCSNEESVASTDE